MVEPIVVYGAGGLAREVHQLVLDCIAAGAGWRFEGFLSDNAADAGRRLNGAPVLGGREVLTRSPGTLQVVIGVGSPVTRRRLAASVGDLAAGFPSVVHPSVIWGRDTITHGPGLVVTAGNILTVNITLGAFVLVNLDCTIGHDTTIGDYCTLAPGVHVSGNVTLGEGCDIGTGAALIQGVSVGAWTVVGAGGVVNRSLPGNATAVGVPAKVIKEKAEGWHLS